MAGVHIYILISFLANGVKTCLKELFPYVGLFLAVSVCKAIGKNINGHLLKFVMKY